MSLSPELENQLMSGAFPTPVHPGDNDVEHIQVHMTAQANDQLGFVHQHIMEHMSQMQAKNQAMQPPQQGAPGGPGGSGPGVAGTPRMGAQPGNPRPQQPPGAMSTDQMPLSMPRKANM